jgi:hypothetical protein
VLGTFTRDLHTEPLLTKGDTHKHDSGLLLTRLRIEGEGAYGDRLFAEVAYDLEMFAGSGLNSLRFDLADEIGTGTWLDADRVFSEHDDAVWRHALYRAWVRYEADRWELTLGRQRIALGRGRLWNPTDLFNPIFPLAIEGDQRIGQDAAVVRAQLGHGLRAAGIWAPQDDQDDHKAAMRLELHRRAIDAALMVGTFQGERVFGADMAASVRGAAFRAEATYSDTDEIGWIWQVVTSVDYNFDVGTGLYFLVEHLYNENLCEDLFGEAVCAGNLAAAAAVGLAQASTDRITTVVRNQTGVQIGYDLTPLLRANLLVLYDWHGPSAAIAPALIYSWRSNVEVSLAAQLFVESCNRCEYADPSNILIFQVDTYF